MSPPASATRFAGKLVAERGRAPAGGASAGDFGAGALATAASNRRATLRAVVKDDRGRDEHGVDGLAAGTSTISLMTFVAIAVISWIRSGDPGHRSNTYLDLAIFGAALIGGTIGFLWFNAHPAEVFMGDTGAMALGGALAGFAVLTKTEVLLIFIGGIYAVVALSVIIQVISFKRTGKRVFLMAPIQHHFEMKAWSETKIMVRFCIVCAILCAIGFVLYYRYYLRFRL